MNKPRNNSPEELIMNEPYLWDGSGKPDPEVHRLESLLAQFSHREIPLGLPQPQKAPAKPGYFHGLLLQFPGLPRFAAVAVVLLALIAGGILSFYPTRVSPSGRGWEVARLDGTPQIGTRFITAGQAAANLRVGQTLETNGTSRASISQTDLGEIKVEVLAKCELAVRLGWSVDLYAPGGIVCGLADSFAQINGKCAGRDPIASHLHF
jgi:hypothetical protein